MAELQRGEVLCVPKRRRLVHSRSTGSGGVEVLHVFYGEKEIIFDEPELLPFGDRLIATESFRAEDAMSWSNGPPHDWDKVRELLEALLDHEILTRVTEARSAAAVRTFPATLGAAPAGLEPRTFSAHRDQCAALTQEAFGHAVDLGNLEVVVPVYRVAHAALDREDRQLGENNVTPRALFLDRPTERRLCKYAGSRHQAELPMNITALRNMTKRWPELLSLTEQYRSAFFARLPGAESSLRVGDAHLLTVGCLASVGYAMVRGVDPIANGLLDPGLAGMFRLIDGVRLVTTDMMRSTAGEHGCERLIDARSVADHAERYTVYHGLYGVCAGPQALIDEYLQVLLDGGRPPIHAQPDLASRLVDLEAAIDYGLHGQRIEALLRIFGASQGLLHERLRVAMHGDPPWTRLQELLELPIDSEHYPLLREAYPLRETLELELGVNRWLFARAAVALPAPAREGRETAEALFEVDPTALAVDRRRLAEFFAAVARDRDALTGRQQAELAAVAAEVFALERRCLRAVGSEQTRLNRRLRRASGRPLTSSDLAVYNRPRTGPALQATLAQGLSLSITTDAAATVLSCDGRSLSLTT